MKEGQSRDKNFFGENGRHDSQKIVYYKTTRKDERRDGN